MNNEDIEKWKRDHADDPKEVSFWNAYEKEHSKNESGNHSTTLLVLVDTESREALQ